MSTTPLANTRRRCASTLLALAMVLLTLATSLVFSGHLPFSYAYKKPADNPRAQLKAARVHTHTTPEKLLKLALHTGQFKMPNYGK